MHRTISGYEKPPTPAPEFQVAYIETPDGAVVVSVHSAMGERLDASNHPQFQDLLRASNRQSSRSEVAV